MKAKRRLFLLIPPAAVLAVVAFVGILGLILVVSSEPPSTFTLLNASGTELTDIIISGRGFRETVKILKPGESVVRRFRPKGKSGVAVAFQAADRSVSVPEQDYVSGGGFKCSIEVSPGFTVAVRCDLVA